MKRMWAVYRKEIVDALRDRRTLIVVLVSSVLLGPLVLIVMSGLLAQFETQAEKRVVVVSGIEHAPTLKNYFERQTYTVQAAPKDHEDLLRRSKLSEPVLVVPDGFEEALLHGDRPVLELVSDSGNRQAEVGTGRVRRLVEGFARERGTLALALRGVAAEVLEPVEVIGRDLASQQSRASQLTAMLPFFVLMAVLYGALNAALDITAGERERGSLEPLLMTPAPRAAVVAGKWLAVASVSALIAVLSCLSFLPAQWLLRSDTLQALFQFGWIEAGLFIATLVPLACALSALLMALAIRCRTFKEAQAASSVLLMCVSMLPLVTVFNQEGEAPWHLWVPALAQHTVMSRMLKGEAVPFDMVAIPLGVCLVLSLLGVMSVARSLRAAAVH